MTVLSAGVTFAYRSHRALYFWGTGGSRSPLPTPAIRQLAAPAVAVFLRAR